MQCHFCQILFKTQMEVFSSVIPISFSQMHLSWNALMAQRGFQTVSPRNTNVYEDTELMSLKYQSRYLLCFHPWVWHGRQSSWKWQQQSVDGCCNKASSISASLVPHNHSQQQIQPITFFLLCFYFFGFYVWRLPHQLCRTSARTHRL